MSLSAPEQTLQRASLLETLGPPSAPYRGIYDFRVVDRPIFPARDRDVRNIFRLVAIYRAIVISGSSGVGKSSLLNAGLIPALIEDGNIVERVRVQPLSNNEFLVERISLRDDETPPFLPSIFAFNESDAKVSLSCGKLEEQIRSFVRGSSALPPQATDSCLVLLCDQFEEFVTLFEEAPETREEFEQARLCQRRVFDTLKMLITEDTVPVKLVFSVREDYQARVLRHFEKFYQQITNQVYPLAQLPESDLPSIIEGPYAAKDKDGHYLFQRRLAPTTCRILEEGLGAKSDDGLIFLTETQIACRTLWDDNQEESHFNKIAEKSGATEAVQYVYDRFMEVAMKRLSVGEQRNAKLALTKLITSSGTRNIVSKDSLFHALAEEGVSKEAANVTINQLSKSTGLVYSQMRGNIPFFEIVSESLVPWILKQDAIFQAEKRGIKEEAERNERIAKLKAEEAEQEKRRQIKEEAVHEAESRFAQYRDKANEAERRLAKNRRYSILLISLVAFVSLCAAIFAVEAVLRTKRAEIAARKAEITTSEAIASYARAADSQQRLAAEVAQNERFITQNDELKNSLRNYQAENQKLNAAIQTAQTEAHGQGREKLVGALQDVQNAVSSSQAKLETATTDLTNVSGILKDLRWVQGSVRVIGDQEGGDSLALILTWNEANRSQVFRPGIRHSAHPGPSDLDPNAYWVAARWDYSVTPRAWLLKTKVMVKNPKTNKQLEATPVDWGPAPDTGAIMNISQGLAKALELKTGDQVAYFVPTPPKPGTSPTATSP
jgi:hypothetical protein